MIKPLLKSITGRVLIEAHRGAEKLAPENSWRALNLGHASGADLLEVDVQLSADGVAFLHHHSTLPDGRECCDVTWNELTEVRIANELLPKLQDVLTWARDVQACLALDLKTSSTPENKLADEVVRLIEQTDTANQVMLIAWDHGELQRVKRAHPEIATRPLIRGRLIDLPGLVRAVGADCVPLSYGIMRPGDVQEMHAMGVAVVLADLWKFDIDFVKNSGVDMVSWGNPVEAKRGLYESQ